MSEHSSPIQAKTAVDSGALPFPSLASLRAAHSELLKRHRGRGDSPDFLAEVNAFVRQGRTTGLVLDAESDRWVAQSMLDYWSTLLYRVGQQPPDVTLADFDEEFVPCLPDVLCPYRGLDAFDETNSRIFFGRQRLVEEMVRRLEQSRLLAVVGPSGSGKSSVVLAGLTPALKSGALPGSENWYYVPRIVPGSDPLANLVRLLEKTRAVPPEDKAAWVREQVAQLQNDPNQLVTLANVGGNVPVVLVVDQFEEVFSLCNDETARRAFIAGLLGLCRSPGLRHTAILTMRSDFVTRMPEFEPLFEASRIQISPLSAAELREAIERPAAAVGLKFEEGVVDALLQDVLGEPAALPLLQFTLLKLWEGRWRNRVIWEAYRRLGGAREALAYTADEFYQTLIPEDQVTARRILLRMVRPGAGLEVTSNRILRETLYRIGEDPGRVDRVLDKLVQARLVCLTEGETPADAQVEVAHEALVRNWPRLVEWLEEERDIIRRRQRLMEDAEHWDRSGRDAGALLSITWLHEAQQAIEASGVQPSPLEDEFIQASQAAIKQVEQEIGYDKLAAHR